MINFNNINIAFNMLHRADVWIQLLEENVLYRTLKGSKALRIWNP